MMEFKIQRLDNVEFNFDELVDYYHDLKNHHQDMKWEPPPGEFADLICSWAIQTKMKNPDLPCDPYHLPDTVTEDYNSDFNSPTKLVFGFAKKIIETFSDIKQTVITVHYPNTILPWHIDTEEYLKTIIKFIYLSKLILKVILGIVTNSLSYKQDMYI